MLDSKEKRQAVASLGLPFLRNTFPNVAKNEQWRMSVGNVYGGNPLNIVVPPNIVITAVIKLY